MIMPNYSKVEFLKDDDVQFVADVSIGCVIMESPTIDTLRSALQQLPSGTNWTSVKIKGGFGGENVQTYGRDQVSKMLNRKQQKPRGPKFFL